MIKGRFFLIGCFRSGTTLLQSMLTVNHTICSFPETNYISAVVGGVRRKAFGIRRKGLCGLIWEALNRTRITLGIASPLTVSLFKGFLKKCDKSDLAHLMKRNPLLIDLAITRYIQTLDIITLDSNCKYWLEKAPENYAYVEYIQRNISDAKYIHLIRAGEDVVASLYDAAHQYPGTFWEKDFLTIDNCITFWNIAISFTRRWSRQKNHIVVFYEELCRDPGIVLKHICGFLDVEYDENMVAEYTQRSEDLILPSEPWKDGVRNKIVVNSKFTKLFSKPESKYIMSCLDSIEDLQFTHGILDMKVE